MSTFPFKTLLAACAIGLAAMHVAWAAGPAPANAAASAPTTVASLDTRIQDAKSDVIQLNRDLLVLEEELLFPANTQVALFVSMNVGKLFELDSVQIKLDDKVVTHYLYTPLEVQALHRGGVQRVYLGNLRAGEHEIVAFFTGKGPHERDYKRGATIKFDKGTEPKYIELRIKDSTGKLQPEFDVKVWQ
ncbi:AraC family transcriptional regulator [Piscinibacter sp.]|uniref:AraC family transcriptional regulator n=1 Tax=Piscinibacter sp. TaxID=1903157 RepID=UPI002B7E31A9|nr:AraC family transcriptional regulator [Albitalea sp.]HUG23547.1 AraC family transcriptional regulator [Albitalea sp.]